MSNDFLDSLTLHLGNMSKSISKQTNFSNFLSKLEEYENVHDFLCIQLITSGRQILQSVYNSIDNEQLTNLTDSFIQFMSLLPQFNPNSLLYEGNALILHEKTSKQNETQDLLPKNDIIKMVNNDLQCPICNEWLFRATSTNCNHTFCETCIQKWLKMNNTCPVCRTSIQYISTSIALDNFISNLCQLFGGFIKEKRESIQNARTNHNNDQSNVDSTVDGLFNNFSISQLMEDDTYISELDTTLPMTHPNVVRLIPQSGILQNPVPRMNLRQLITSSNTPHSNTVHLSPLSNISEHPNMVRLIPHSRVLQNPVSSINLRQPIASSNTPRSNIVKLSPFPQSSIISVASPRANQSQPTSVVRLCNNHFQSTSPTPIVSPSVHRLRTNRNESSNRYNPNIASLSSYGNR